MNKELLEKFVADRESAYSIAKKTGKSHTTVRYWLKKYNLKTTATSSWNKWQDINFSEIQKRYDAGLSERMIFDEFGVNRGTLCWAAERGLFKYRTHQEAMNLGSKLGRMKGATTWTQKLRDDARDRMLKRIELDPSCHPNRKLAGNRGKMSFPEKLANDFLVANGIKFNHSKYIKPYWVDFLIDDHFILEVDGERWHDKERDAIRDDHLIRNGYEVFRIPAKAVIKDVSVLNEFLLVCRRNQS